MSNFFVSINIESIFWNDLLIMIQIFNIVRQSTINFNFETIIIIVVVDANKSIINSTKNIDYFDSKYSNSSNKNSFIMNFDRYIYYRDVYVFIDWLKNLKQNFFDFRIKKYVFACMKNDILAWLSTELNILKKNLLRKIDVENWYKALIRRFKKRDVVALKKLQSSFYIFIDVRNDKTSRVYVQIFYVIHEQLNMILFIINCSTHEMILN